MRILVTGAAGFLGRHVVAALIGAGHDVVCCLRDPARAQRIFPGATCLACDFNRDTAPEAWLPRLAGVDAVVNCVGILQERRGQSIEAIHGLAPRALFEACLSAGVRRVIQISALGVDGADDTAYARTKLAADRHLQGLDLDWLVLRPSLAYSESGSYGGTSLFRALAALPFFVPVVGDGRQLFQPIHLADLAEAVRRLVEPGAPARRVIAVVGPQPIPLVDILLALRAWLGLPPAPVLRVPRALVACAARLGDASGAGPFNTTALRMLSLGATADPGPLMEATGLAPRAFHQALATAPAHVQDRWHARLYVLRPVLRTTLALFWIASGAIAAVAGPWAEAWRGLWPDGPSGPGLAAFWGLCLADMALGGLLLARWRVPLVGAVQILAVLGYLALATAAWPALWLYPLGPLVKLLPLLVATLVMMAIEDQR